MAAALLAQANSLFFAGSWQCCILSSIKKSSLLANVKPLAKIEHVSYCLSCLDRFRSIRTRGLQVHTMKEYRVDEGRNTLDKIALWFLCVN